jgi:hypothetical protein
MQLLQYLISMVAAVPQAVLHQHSTLLAGNEHKTGTAVQWAQQRLSAMAALGTCGLL